MIILTSNGLSSDGLINEIRKFVSPSMRAVIITTASVGYKEKDWHIPRLTSELDRIGLPTDYLDIEFESLKLLEKYDLVEINGGNPFFLLQQLRLQRAKEVLSKFAEKKILIGISAGSIVLQKNIKLIAQYSPEMNDAVHLEDLNGLDLTDYEILPHYHRFSSKFEKFEEKARAYEKDNNCSVIRLNDGEGFFICGETGYKI